MKSTLSIILFTTIELGLFAQEKAVEKATSKISLGLIVSPEAAFRSLTIAYPNDLTDEVLAIDNEVDRYMFGKTFGLNITYSLNEHFSLESGLQYSQKGWQTKWLDLYYGDNIDPRKGYTYPDPNEDFPSKARIAHKQNYLDIPLLVTYQMGKKKLSFIGSLGMSANFLLSSFNKNTVVYKSGNEKNHILPDLNNYKKVNLSSVVMAGVDYRFTDKLSLRLMPSFKYGLFVINSAPIVANLWSYGVNIGAYYRL